MDATIEQVNEESSEEIDTKKVERAYKAIHESMCKKGLSYPEQLAVAATLFTTLIFEMAEEGESYRELFMTAIGMLDDAFIAFEETEEERQPPIADETE